MRWTHLLLWIAAAVAPADAWRTALGVRLASRLAHAMRATTGTVRPSLPQLTPASDADLHFRSHKQIKTLMSKTSEHFQLAMVTAKSRRRRSNLLRSGANIRMAMDFNVLDFLLSEKSIYTTLGTVIGSIGSTLAIRINDNIGFPTFLGVASSEQLKEVKSDLKEVKSDLEEVKSDLKEVNETLKSGLKEVNETLKSTLKEVKEEVNEKLDKLTVLFTGAVQKFSPIACSMMETSIIEKFHELEFSVVRDGKGHYQIRAKLPSAKVPLSALLPKPINGTDITPSYRLRLVPSAQRLGVEVERMGPEGAVLAYRDLTGNPLKRERIKVQDPVVLDGPNQDGQSDVWVCNLRSG